ncbi:hypothetical protein NDN08_003322 [Rhodosorus marinus]|uniref:Right handed beta helix domain-containing protein n=1 Tax=Rhodosorus marinus TaxID=101924 RepID=A0AAV8V233_9RHOD|nr:hypothetical protein NDN08_003322 [Rhodosorus marinus]
MKLFVFLLAVIAVATSCADVIPLDCDKPLKTQIEGAPIHSELVAYDSCVWMVDETIRVRNPVTIRGVTARLPDGLGNAPLLEVRTEGFTMTDFEFIGNIESVEFEDRESLVAVAMGGFHIERGVLRSSSQHGILVRPMGFHKHDIVGGVLRDLAGYGNRRDLVSITSMRQGEYISRNIVAENLRAYNQWERGTIEVTDGAKDVYISNVYAENCFYAVDIQDHDEGNDESLAHVNRVFVSNVIAMNCTWAIHSETFVAGHSDISISGVVATDCMNAVLLDRINRLTLTDVKVVNGRNESTQVDIAHAKYVNMRELSFAGGVGESSAITLRQSEKVRVQDVTLADDTNFKYGITVNATVPEQEAFATLSFTGNDLEAASEEEIQYYFFHESL